MPPATTDTGFHSFAKTVTALHAVAVDPSGAGEVTNAIAGDKGQYVCVHTIACTRRHVSRSAKATEGRQAARRS